MIWEYWQHLTTPTAIVLAKEMGFLKESIALASRAKRCKATWNPHYQNCQASIVQAVQRSVGRRSVLIFGAGSLRDIPLAYLAQQFHQVILVDLVFLKSARAQAQSFDNVVLIEHDVTESLQGFYTQQTHVEQPQAWLNDASIDLVISLNLITQLPLIPVRWLLSHGALTELQADKLAKKIIYGHLHYLKQFAGEVCLIADEYGVEYDKAGKETDKVDPWWGIEPPKAVQNWSWELMPLGEQTTQIRQVNHVGVTFF
ncbi:hypothetical protein [Thiomicrorhabdus aquaedulcis]|uniref:hypothetical protein n=1 Tax=Thiomicrorhabdus aquaedulcis TaxID=2211106 RepID=UPI000FD90176|nr:hypothetical protein [Thiomicrorhabdus aquaedulcis]